MQAKNQPALSSSSPSLYELESIEDGFAFTTDQGTAYILSFRDDANYFLGKNFYGPIFSFSITLVSGEIGLRDDKIRGTVYDALSRTFAAQPTAIINYTCSRTNAQEVARAKLFKMWFSSYQDEFTRVDHEHKDDRLYVTAIWREDHPRSEAIREAFRVVYLNK